MNQLVDIMMPPGQDSEEAVVLGWLKKPGDAVAIHEPVLEISTDKVTIEVPAPASGTLQDVLKAPDETIHPGDVLGRIAVAPPADAEAPTPNRAPTPESRAPAPESRAPNHDARAPKDAEPVAEALPDRRQRLSPLVKRMLREHDLQPDQIAGTGRGGRITHQDVKAFLKRGAESHPEAPPSAPPPSAPPPAASVPAAGRRVPHTPMRRRIANHMVESMLRTAPHVTALFDADLTAVIDHRARHKATFAAQGVKLTYTAYFAYAAVQALQAVPDVNSRWHDDALEVFTDINLGIATALGKDGLIVPVIHQAQHLGLFGLAARLQERTDQARSGTLTREAVQHGTFTITNHGVSGSLLATPIINQPQSAILGIGRVEKRVVVRSDRGRDVIQINPMVYVTLTIDHRALDGFQANAFLARFVEVLENWT